MSSSKHRYTHTRARGRVPRTLLRAGLAVSAAGAALISSGAASAAAAPSETQLGPVLDEIGPAIGELAPIRTGNLSLPDAVDNAVPAVTHPVRNLQPHPLAATPVDPLNNEVGTRIGASRPVSSRMITEPLSQGAAVGELPGVQDAAVLLPD